MPSPEPGLYQRLYQPQFRPQAAGDTAGADADMAKVKQLVGK